LSSAQHVRDVPTGIDPPPPSFAVRVARELPEVEPPHARGAVVTRVAVLGNVTAKVVVDFEGFVAVVSEVVLCIFFILLLFFRFAGRARGRRPSSFPPSFRLVVVW
jgi:hypothetical protein|tara:strand:- start:2365 stop:2682 length:318 start_codon:yes stop_codon:yes gene_type:complete